MHTTTLSLCISLLAAAGTVAVGTWTGVINYKISRRTAFINTVTAERAKWISKIREDISTFVGLIHYFSYSMVPRKEDITEKGQIVIRELSHLRYLIELQLNPTDDKEIINSIEKIVNLTHQPNIDVLKAAIDKLVIDSQLLLKKEWEKVKDEAKLGDIRRKKGNKRMS